MNKDIIDAQARIPTATDARSAGPAAPEPGPATARTGRAKRPMGALGYLLCALALVAAVWVLSGLTSAALHGWGPVELAFNGHEWHSAEGSEAMPTVHKLAFTALALVALLLALMVVPLALFLVAAAVLLLVLAVLGLPLLAVLGVAAVLLSPLWLLGYLLWKIMAPSPGL